MTQPYSNTEERGLEADIKQQKQPHSSMQPAKATQPPLWPEETATPAKVFRESTTHALGNLEHPDEWTLVSTSNEPTYQIVPGIVTSPEIETSPEMQAPNKFRSCLSKVTISKAKVVPVGLVPEVAVSIKKAITLPSSIPSVRRPRLSLSGVTTAAVRSKRLRRASTEVQFSRRVSKISKRMKTAVRDIPRADEATYNTLRDWWENQCEGHDSMKMVGLVMKELPREFGDELDLAMIQVDVLRIKGRMDCWRLSKKLTKIQQSIVNKNWYIIFLTIVCWMLPVSVLVDNDWFALGAILAWFGLFAPVGTLLLDFTQWRVLLGHTKNVYVFIISLCCFFLACFALSSDTEPAARAALAISFLAATFVFPFYEVLDIPLAIAFLCIPALVTNMAVVIIKYHTTNVLYTSGINDSTIAISSLGEYSVAYLLVSCLTVNLSLIGMKMHTLWSVWHGATLPLFGKHTRVRLVKSRSTMMKDTYVQSHWWLVSLFNVVLVCLVVLLFVLRTTLELL